jgi:hypothetical protein
VTGGGAVARRRADLDASATGGGLSRSDKLHATGGVSGEERAPGACNNSLDEATTVRCRLGALNVERRLGAGGDCIDGRSNW